MCTLDESGLLYCWGSNAYGQLGTDSVPWSLRPIPVMKGYSFTTACAGDQFTCGITLDGTTLCWGDNSRGQLGAPEKISETLSTPTPVAEPFGDY